MWSSDFLQIPFSARIISAPISFKMLNSYRTNFFLLEHFSTHCQLLDSGEVWLNCSFVFLFPSEAVVWFRIALAVGRCCVLKLSECLVMCELTGRCLCGEDGHTAH